LKNGKKLEKEQVMLKKHLQQYFGFTAFKKGQEEVIQRILNRQSAGAIFPTGAGKSLCYQLPAMLLPGMTLVISPLLSLMKDQIDFLSRHNIPAARLDSTLSHEDYMHILEQAKSGKLKILMIAVERLKNERFRQHLRQMKVALMVVDEAHCISEWGHNFRPEYLKLPTYQKEFQISQALLLTATATEQVRDDMCRKFNIDRKNVTATGFYRQNLFLQVTPTEEAGKKQELLNRLQENTKASTIVYVTLQKTAEEVARFLTANQINAAYYHAGMSNDERENIQNLFMEGKLDCVAATIAFGMGIDKGDLRRVIHYDLPKSIENYSQEIGRSGRDGLSSFCEVLANRDNISVLENFIYGDTPERSDIYKLLEQIKNNENLLWKLKLISLSNEVNIRPLPLKTLLVYLDMEDIIRPKYIYFDEYFFKYCDAPEQIIDRFQGERQQFLRSLFSHCQTKKIWTYVDMSSVLHDYQTDRSRVVTALEYFAEKKWIELQAKQPIESYDILTQAFDLDQLTDKMFHMFSNKEAQEIQRIHHMVSFLGTQSCLNKQLAAYFGEQLAPAACGHCSVCKQSGGVIPNTVALLPLAGMDFYDLSHDFLRIADKDASFTNITKFLCGVYTPLFKNLKIKTLPHFGLLERYPFHDVRQWVAEQQKLGKYSATFPGINQEDCETQHIPARQKLRPANESVTIGIESSERKKYLLVIGERFNQGHTIEQLAVDFDIPSNTVIDHLNWNLQNDHPINKKYLLENSHLTGDQLLSALSYFDHLGTERLDSVFKNLNGTISYEDLKLLRLYLLCQRQTSLGSDDLKTFIVLAASRKYGGYCIAGKEWSDGKIGPWVRPVSRRTNGELSAQDVIMNNNVRPCCMDIVEVKSQGPASHAYQKENFFIVVSSPWIWQWKLPDVALPKLVDEVDSLWLTGFSSTSGLNDRVPEEIVVKSHAPSLYLIRPDDFMLLVSDDLYGKKKVNARFTYRGTIYLLSVTDSIIEREYLVKAQDEYSIGAKNVFLTVSMGEPFNGFCYKLVAAVITQDMD